MTSAEASPRKASNTQCNTNPFHQLAAIVDESEHLYIKANGPFRPYSLLAKYCRSDKPRRAKCQISCRGERGKNSRLSEICSWHSYDISTMVDLSSLSTRNDMFQARLVWTRCSTSYSRSIQNSPTGPMGQELISIRCVTCDLKKHAAAERRKKSRFRAPPY